MCLSVNQLKAGKSKKQAKHPVINVRTSNSLSFKVSDQTLTQTNSKVMDASCNITKSRK